MTTGRKQRLKEARLWYPEQNFTADSHIVKAYRQRFSVDKTCAMRELMMLGLLPEEKQKAYKEQLASRDRKLAEKRERRAASDADVDNTFQDENFFFIAGYTPGGAPYGVTWEEARRDGLVDE
jgi:hypothetical protein